MKRLEFIIEEIDGKMAITVLKPGYNIIQETIYNDRKAKAILKSILSEMETNLEEG